MIYISSFLIIICKPSWYSIMSFDNDFHSAIFLHKSDIRNTSIKFLCQFNIPILRETATEKKIPINIA